MGLLPDGSPTDGALCVGLMGLSVPGQGPHELNQGVAGALAPGAARHWRTRREAHGTGAFHGLRVRNKTLFGRPMVAGLLLNPM